MTLPERRIELCGLPTTVIGAESAPLMLVLLHGYAMEPKDLAPFAHSIGIPALFVFPRGPLLGQEGGYAWWSIDSHARHVALAAGPRDLAEAHPPGLDGARRQLDEFLDAVMSKYPAKRLVLGGFSQGGMLSLDLALRGSRSLEGLVLLSASRIALRDWQPHRGRLRGLPVFVSHGQADSDLAFAAGERLRDFVLESAAEVSWVPFDGGHEIPLVVWRGLRKFLAALVK